MLKKLLFGLLALVGLVLGGGLLLPSKYRVERSISIRAAPEAVYDQVARPRRWREWAPWNEQRYPGSEWSFAGPEVGVGAIQSWRGEEVGTGSLILREADPETGVAYEVSLSHGRYTLSGSLRFAREEGGTRVTWVDEGEPWANPLARYPGLLVPPMLGGNLEEGLARLKARVEAEPAPVPVEAEPAPVPVEVAPVVALPPLRELPPVAPDAGKAAPALVEATSAEGAEGNAAAGGAEPVQEEKQRTSPEAGTVVAPP
jgi:hypothetical protein